MEDHKGMQLGKHSSQFRLKLSQNWSSVGGLQRSVPRQISSFNGPAAFDTQVMMEFSRSASMSLESRWWDVPDRYLTRHVP